MEAIILRQKEIIKSIEQLNVNFKKESKSRKTPEYIEKKLNLLDNLYEDFIFNNTQLEAYSDKSHEYFAKNMYMQLKTYYDATRKMMTGYSSTAGASTMHDDSDRQSNEKLKELIHMQKTNFRAFKRLAQNFKALEVLDKWEVEDKLRNLQSRWNNIDSLHWQIDNILEGSDTDYEEQYTYHENMYEDIKKILNRKLQSTAHIQHSTPQLEIPIFSGNYTQWPTFLDLFKETIHNSNILTKAQKMQHLKSKLRGEAERLIQHLHISSDNYDTAWSIINQRYNNQQLLFTKQIEIFLNQPNVQKQSSLELKRLHDVSTECINAIQNLGVDTTTWGPLLVHLITKKLDPNTLRDFQESRKSPRELSTFTEIMAFLETKFTALAPMYRQPDTFHNKPSSSASPMKKDFSKTFHAEFHKSSYNRAYHTSIATSNCPLCNNNNHALYNCKKFENMPANEKQSVLLKYKICNNCLYVHEHNICKSQKRCKKCFQAHNTLLHDIFTTRLGRRTQQQHNTQSTVGHVHCDDEILLTTVQLQVQANDGTYLTLRGLLDQGSQSTLITENAVQRLALPRHHCNANVSGVGTLSNKIRGKVLLTCKSSYGDYEFTTEALVISKLINSLPTQSFPKKNYVYLQNLNLADPEYNNSNQIDILFDARIYSQIIMDGLLRGLPEQPIAQQTKLGWILSGNVTKNLNCHVVLNSNEDISRFWEIEDIPDNNTKMTDDEKYCEDFYVSTTRRLPNGKYEVRLPLKPNFQKYLGKSKTKALAQFQSLEHKFSKNKQLQEDYRKFMQEYIDLEHMQECDRSYQASSSTCYLPHHGVYKHDSSTTKLRVVFNASSKTSKGYSLNDLMEAGPKLQQDILELLIQWRSFKYVYSADCEKMYRMILLHPEDQQLQKIIWRDDTNESIREYQLCTLTYGMKASPFLAMRTMKQLARDEAERYPLAAHILENNFYVDDLLAGTDNIEEAKQLQKQLIKMMLSAGFNLRKWSSNSQELLKGLNENQVDPTFIDFKHQNSTKTLGLRWDAASDIFKFQSTIDINFNTNKCMTKRKMLSTISKIFDPLGFFSPISIKAKLLFQHVWLNGIGWDELIPNDMQQELIELTKDLKNISTIQIPRWLGSTRNPVELHGFADSSEKAYACSIYLKAKDNMGNITVTLIAAKTKLAPIKKTVTLPRLELCATVLLARLMQKVKHSLSHLTFNIFGWTDSMIALGWIHGDCTRWKTFVANRVKIVTDIMPASCWNHTSSKDNAADCATRGMSSEQLKNHNIWWEGPSWLKNGSLDIKNLKIDMPCLETKKQKQVHVVQIIKSPMLLELLHKYSTLTRATRVLSWIFRFITNARSKNVDRKFNCLTFAEIEESRILFIKVIQQEYFCSDITKLIQNSKISSKSNILSLNPFLDKNNILRVGGRLQHSNLTYSSKHPILLPHESHLTDLLIMEAHKSTLHGGPSLTLTTLREKYWIMGGMRAVKKQLRKCVICRRFRNQRKTQLMADLPEQRVIPSRPFTHTGVDFTGYVDIKANKGRGIKTTKGYIAVFICCSTKAIHLELVSDLTTSSFLAAFKRLCARRGVPKHVYSDNGTNFLGASRVLQKEFQAGLLTTNQYFLDNISSMSVNWHFNAPLWPTAGGLWEAAVKSVKHHLRRIIGEQKLTFEEFYTLLTQIEACLNSRPLYRLSENIEDGFITPGHFLIGAPLLSSPLSDITEPSSLTTRWQVIERMQKVFWKKWSTEYLQQLQARHKWKYPTKNMQINDIVLVNDDNMPPSKWALAKVQELHPGKDGHVRVVTLKTANGYVKRPITKLTPLLEEPHKDQIDNLNKRRRNRRGSLSCLLTTLLLLFSCISPSLQQVNVTTLSKNNTLYFDKIADLRIIQDEWKMVIYYNMTTYWQSMRNVDQYISHLKRLCSNEKTFIPIISQLDHELTELEYYNEIMIHKPTRRIKRGLINGIGYVANSLFGVLDDRFAQKYEKDIDALKVNEYHLFTMLKNQTSILEAENNILRRNENLMNQHFIFINEHLKNVSLQINQIKNTTEHVLNTYYIMTTALSANIIISNLRRIQDTLIDTLTDIYHGKVDIHLFSPNQLQRQLNLISSQIHEELTIPVADVRDLYTLLRIQATMTDKYLIMEIKIPLLYRDVFELNRIISLPLNKGNTSIFNIAATNFIAYNLKKDIFMPMTESDLYACIKAKSERILCYENSPIYNIKLYNSICELHLTKTMNNDDKDYCHPEVRRCGDAWIKLQTHGAWLYSCCQQCTVRILCTAGIVVKQLSDNGIINIPIGCMLKSEQFTIHAQYNYQNKLLMSSNIGDTQITHQPSPLNSIIDSSIPDTILNKIEDHEKTYEQITHQIEGLKNQDIQLIHNTDAHHTVTYIAIIAIITTIVGYILYKMTRTRWRCRTSDAVPEARQPEPPAAAALRDSGGRVRAVDMATSPTIIFENLPEP